MAIWEHFHTPPWELQHATPDQLRQACDVMDKRNREAEEVKRV